MIAKYQQDYVDSLRNAGKAQATILAYNKDVDQFVEFLRKRSKTDPKQVDKEDFQDYKAELRALRYSDKSISRKLNSLKSFFKYLKQQSVVPSNPVNSVAHPKYKVTPPRVLNKVEYHALRDVVKRDARMRAIIELLLQTGMRISELAALQMEDLNFDKKEIFIRSQGSQEARMVPMNEPVITALQEYFTIRPRTKERTVFLTKSCRPFLVRNIRSAIDRFFKTAEIHDAKVNDLRHTFIVHQLRANVPLLNVSKIVGHKRLSTTEKYLQFVDEDDVENGVELQAL